MEETDSGQIPWENVNSKISQNHRHSRAGGNLGGCSTSVLLKREFLLQFEGKYAGPYTRSVCTALREGEVSIINSLHPFGLCDFILRALS